MKLLLCGFSLLRSLSNNMISSNVYQGACHAVYKPKALKQRLVFYRHYCSSSKHHVVPCHSRIAEEKRHAHSRHDLLVDHLKKSRCENTSTYKAQSTHLGDEFSPRRQVITAVVHTVQTYTDATKVLAACIAAAQDFVQLNTAESRVMCMHTAALTVVMTSIGTPKAVMLKIAMSTPSRALVFWKKS